MASDDDAIAYVFVIRDLLVIKVIQAIAKKTVASQGYAGCCHATIGENDKKWKD